MIDGGGDNMRTKVQVICIHADNDVDLEERINALCDDLSKKKLRL